MVRKNSHSVPATQIAVLMGVRMAEPIAYTFIFPFINQWIEELHVTDNPDKVGFYSGLVESAFAFVQLFTVYHWATLSDRIGRKPVILAGLLGVVIATTTMGFSTTFWMVLFCRCISGALNGNVAVIKASLGDITDEHNSTDAFALYGLTWTIGSILGNALGGLFGHPEQRWPKLFSARIWAKHPYLLACIISASTTLLGTAFAVVVYKESLPTISQHTSVWQVVSNVATLPVRALGFGRQRGHIRITSDTSTATLVTPPRSPVVSVLMSPISSPVRSTYGGGGGGMRYEDVERLEEDIEGYAHHHKIFHTGQGLGLSIGDDDDHHPALHPPEERNRDLEMAVNAPLLSQDERAGQMGGPVKQWGFWELIKFWPVQVTCMCYFLNSFIGGAWAAVSLLFFYDRRHGLGMSAAAIGGALAFNGLWSIACQLLFLTRIKRALGLSRAYMVLNGFWVVLWLLLPVLRQVLEWAETPESGNEADGGLTYGPTRGWVITIGVNALLSLVAVVQLSNSLLMVLTNAAVPDRSAFGAVNGIGTAVGSAARVVGPSLCSVLYAISMDSHVLGGRLWWVFMAIMSMLSLTAGAMIPKDIGEGPLPDATAIEEDEEDEYDDCETDHDSNVFLDASHRSPRTLLGARSGRA